ncbi:hypothetical protein [Pseudalkalibacillus hwajinpoensis]|nr:hypothetical protein [Pseudalkalibacillus hwajinpoensis]
MTWEPNWYEENLGYPKPEELDSLTQEEFEKNIETFPLLNMNMRA